VLIIVFLVLEPRGLAGIWRRIQAYFRTWPFSY
jgi:branched-chain amino acid transport system permease protein